jgi:hypothetical protein
MAAVHITEQVLGKPQQNVNAKVEGVDLSKAHLEALRGLGIATGLADEDDPPELDRHAASRRETWAGAKVDRPAGVRTPLSAKPGLRVLVWTYRFWKRRPVRPLPFRSLLSQLAPMEGSHLHHVSGKEGACQPSQSLALRRFAEAFFTGFHHALPTENRAAV